MILRRCWDMQIRLVKVYGAITEDQKDVRPRESHSSIQPHVCSTCTYLRREWGGVGRDRVKGGGTLYLDTQE